MYTQTSSRISPRQSDYLDTLLKEAAEMLDRKFGITSVPDVEAGAAIQRMRDSIQDMSKTEASKAISRAIANNKILRREIAALENASSTPETATEEHVFVSEVGMYRVGERIFKVLPSRSSDRHYAKELTGFHWEDKLPLADQENTDLKFTYAKGAMYLIKAEHRMPEKMARAFGELTGCCCCCGKLLTDPESIRKGIGPVCEKKYF